MSSLPSTPGNVPMTIRKETTRPTTLRTVKTACSGPSRQFLFTMLRTVPYSANARMNQGTKASA